MSKYNYHIHIQGIVQGVGFRPFVYVQALSRKLNGWVNNSSDGVHIEINTTEREANDFLNDILKNAPLLSEITDATIVEVPHKVYNSFEISESDPHAEKNLLLTPDFAICPDCSKDIIQGENKRFDYAFTTCTNCGPRYSIITSLPYDRHTTTMEQFEMCPSCNNEYNNPLDRRYFSQTNSCPDCPIEMTIHENDKAEISLNNLQEIVDLWEEGKIIAIKGIGGFLLTCDATNEETILRLRRLKSRPSKPFALMYHDVYILAEDVEMDICEKQSLESKSAPIVLFNLKNEPYTHLALEAIAPGLNQIGVMLPYTPLYQQLLSLFKKPIVATSGNRSNETIVFENKKALEALPSISDLQLLNNRDIVIPQDDSVCRFSPNSHLPVIIRRSRGLAPSFIQKNLDITSSKILATGAMLKSTFAISSFKNLYISQYLGSTDNYEAELNYKHTLEHLFRLLDFNPEHVVIDKHPGYFSHQYGKELAVANEAKIHQIQHHEAHFYAVLGENDLMLTSEKILGVIWDGTGLGNDQQIWGAEFFQYESGNISRLGHLPYYPFILGDKMPKEPRISALCLLAEIEATERIESYFTKTEFRIYQQMLAKSEGLKSSSMGRLFDGVAAILLGIQKQTYEGEAAMKLENAAYRYFKKSAINHFYTYLKKEQLPENFTKFIIRNICEDIDKGYDTDFIAAKFHISLAHYIYLFAKKSGITKVAFSGGVFQNVWLLELILHFMKGEFELYFHKQLSPNDECISFGQLIKLNHDLNQKK